MTFQQMGLSEPILRAVSAAGYTQPTPIQAQAIGPVLAGRDLLGCAQTGTGKTAAFALPIVHRLTQGDPPRKGHGRRIRALVLSPTRELAVQISESFLTYGAETPLRVATILGGVSQHSQARALKHGVDIVVATPGRLLDLIQQGLVDLSAVQALVLDEADRMLDMGFLPDVRRIIRFLPQKRQSLLFSATMPEDIRQLADSILRDPVQIRVAVVKATAELIQQSIYQVSPQHKPELLAHLLMNWTVTRALVFTRTKRGADKVERMLTKSKLRAEAIHGNKSQNARQRTLANFKSGRTPILVATDLAARGIDVDGISHVVNYDLPEQAETYVHRIGRTGRAGASGVAVSFCTVEDRGDLSAIERLIRQKLPVERANITFSAAVKQAPERGERRPVRGKSDEIRRREPSGQRGKLRTNKRPRRPAAEGAAQPGGHGNHAVATAGPRTAGDQPRSVRSAVSGRSQPGKKKRRLSRAL